MSGRLERIRIATDREDGGKNVRLPWASRDVLLQQLRRAEGTQEITKAFEDAGTSRPVTLTIEQKALLFRVLEDWALTSSFDRMPAGLFGLRNALERRPARRPRGKFEADQAPRETPRRARAA